MVLDPARLEQLLQQAESMVSAGRGEEVCWRARRAGQAERGQLAPLLACLASVPGLCGGHSCKGHAPGAAVVPGWLDGLVFWTTCLRTVLFFCARRRCHVQILLRADFVDGAPLAKPRGDDDMWANDLRDEELQVTVSRTQPSHVVPCRQ